MATKKNETINDKIDDINDKVEDEYVDYEIPWERGQKTPCKNVIINGKKYSIPIGQPVRIPYYVAEVLEGCKRQYKYAEAVDRQMQKTQITEF